MQLSMRELGGDDQVVRIIDEEEPIKLIEESMSALW